MLSVPRDVLLLAMVLGGSVSTVTVVQSQDICRIENIWLLLVIVNGSRN